METSAGTKVAVAVVGVVPVDIELVVAAVPVHVRDVAVQVPRIIA